MTEADRVVALEAEVEALRDRVERLEQQLAPESSVPPQLSATRYERRILGILMARAQVRTETLSALLGNLDIGDMDVSTVRVHVSRLRKKLPAGAEIQPIFGVGYWMNEASKAAVRALGAG